MKKQIFYIATMTLLLTGFNSIPDVKKSQASEIFPSVGKSVQFPENQSRFVRHEIKINIPDNSKAMSTLKIIVPKGLTVKNDIKVHKESGEEIKVNTLVENNTITINFPEPISYKTQLEIDLKQVVISPTGNQWLYRIYGKFVGIIPEINLGVASIRIYV